MCYLKVVTVDKYKGNPIHIGKVPIIYRLITVYGSLLTKYLTNYLTNVRSIRGFAAHIDDVNHIDLRF